jgi:hypothetical protein
MNEIGSKMRTTMGGTVWLDYIERASDMTVNANLTPR